GRQAAARWGTGARGALRGRVPAPRPRRGRQRRPRRRDRPAAARRGVRRGNGGRDGRGAPGLPIQSARPAAARL
ncbi:MAG: hypothetical protein AVDCRST_MAG39-462, partial [uncultured Sphingomonadaceae bacterium]